MAIQKRKTKLSHAWQTEFGNAFATEPVGGAVEVSRAVRDKWGAVLLGACEHQ